MKPEDLAEEKFTLITGARSGLGKAIALYCASRGMNLLLVSLPGKDLKEVAEMIRMRFNIKIYYFEIDLSVQDAPVRVYNWVIENNFRVNILINNAGRGGTIPFENSDLYYNDYRINLNIRSLVALTFLFLPLLKKSEKSCILNVSSLSAFFPIPFKSLYSSTKAFVVNFSRALGEELRDSAVSVSVVCPNLIKTNINTIARIRTHGWIVRFVTLDVHKIAKISVDGMLRSKKVIIPGRINRLMFFTRYFIPLPLLLKILYREFRKEIKVKS
jgi:short-subunit dehydrogenase